MYDLTTKEELHTYLAAGGRSPISIQPLSGGTANYVYRVEFSGGDTSIYKHAAPYLSSNPDFAFDPARMDFEAAILKAILPFQDISTSAAHAVRLLEYDSEHKLLRIEDGGERTLKQAYNDPDLDIVEIGSRLANWLARLHRTMDPSLCFKDSAHSPSKGHANNQIAVQIYRYSYNNLHTALSKYGHSTEIASLVNEHFGSLLKIDDECLCHGDFWPGNVLLKNTNQEPATSNTSNLPTLTIVDWEMSASSQQKHSCSTRSAGIEACEKVSLIRTLLHVRAMEMARPSISDGFSVWQYIGRCISRIGPLRCSGRMSRGLGSLSIWEFVFCRLH
jgi:aminoglycoside phosphotransferase (APT) family kinase protein